MGGQGKRGRKTGERRRRKETTKISFERNVRMKPHALFADSKAYKVDPVRMWQATRGLSSAEAHFAIY